MTWRQWCVLALVAFKYVVSDKLPNISYLTIIDKYLLLCFALVAAGYVLREGLRKGDRTTHELLLKCVIIITSVVPRQLPMQMAMAVNTALMALMKAGIFCTEPYRVPFAGKITHCLFDKTGTITTDQLVPVGIVNACSAPATASKPCSTPPIRITPPSSSASTAGTSATVYATTTEM